jgi:HrpA-like RNA helicase
MTDAALVRRVQKDPLLSGVSVLIIDEAHERSLNTDLVLGISKQLASNPERPNPLHVVIASATIDPKPFVQYFKGDHSNEALERHVLDVKGRVFPVDVEYKPFKDGGLRLRIPDHVIPVLRETMEVIKRCACCVGTLPVRVVLHAIVQHCLNPAAFSLLVDQCSVFPCFNIFRSTQRVTP